MKVLKAYSEVVRKEDLTAGYLKRISLAVRPFYFTVYSIHLKYNYICKMFLGNHSLHAINTE